MPSGEKAASCTHKDWHDRSFTGRDSYFFDDQVKMVIKEQHKVLGSQLALTEKETQITYDHSLSELFATPPKIDPAFIDLILDTDAPVNLDSLVDGLRSLAGKHNKGREVTLLLDLLFLCAPQSALVSELQRRGPYDLYDPNETANWPAGLTICACHRMVFNISRMATRHRKTVTAALIDLAKNLKCPWDALVLARFFYGKSDEVTRAVRRFWEKTVLKDDRFDKIRIAITLDSSYPKEVACSLLAGVDFSCSSRPPRDPNNMFNAYRCLVIALHGTSQLERQKRKLKVAELSKPMMCIFMSCLRWGKLGWASAVLADLAKRLPSESIHFNFDQVCEANTRAAAAEAARDRAEKAETRALQQIWRLSMRLEEEKSEVNNQTKQADRAKIEELERKNKELEDKVYFMTKMNESTCEMMRQEVATAAAAKAEADECLKNMKISLANNLARMDKMRASLEDMTTRVAKITSERDAAQKEMADLMAKLDDIRSGWVVRRGQGNMMSPQMMHPPSWPPPPGMFHPAMMPPPQYPQYPFDLSPPPQYIGRLMMRGSGSGPFDYVKHKAVTEEPRSVLEEVKVLGRMVDGISRSNSPNSTPNSHYELDKVIGTNYENEKIDDARRNELDEVMRRLKDTIGKNFRNSEFRLETYGSSVNGFGSNRSDFDVSFLYVDNADFSGKSDERQKTTLDRIESALKYSNDLFREVSHITNARVPIVKFSTQVGSIKVQGDISYDNELARYNTRLLKRYCTWTRDDLLSKLGVFIKRWAKECGICDASKGSLCSYAWIILLIHFLQRVQPDPLLPVLQQIGDVREKLVGRWDVFFCDDKPEPYWSHCTLSVGELFLEFLDYFSKFDWENQVIQISQRICFGMMTKKEKGWLTQMVIEDPFGLDRNLGHGVSNEMFIFIKKALSRSHEIFSTIRKSAEDVENFSQYGADLLSQCKASIGSPPLDPSKSAKSGRLSHFSSPAQSFASIRAQM